MQLIPMNTPLSHLPSELQNGSETLEVCTQGRQCRDVYIVWNADEVGVYVLFADELVALQR